MAQPDLGEPALWHVTLTVAGDAVDPTDAARRPRAAGRRAAVHGLDALRPGPGRAALLGRGRGPRRRGRPGAAALGRPPGQRRTCRTGRSSASRSSTGRPCWPVVTSATPRRWWPPGSARSERRPGCADRSRWSPRVAVGSASIAQPAYWWYQARESLLAGGARPATSGCPTGCWTSAAPTAERRLAARLRHARRVPGHRPARPGRGRGLRLGPRAALRRRESFDVVAAFDVVEHCEPEGTALAELARVLDPGRPAADVGAGVPVGLDPLRRRERPPPALHPAPGDRGGGGAGLVVERATYAFMRRFPLFAAERLYRRLRERAAGRHARAGAGRGAAAAEVAPAGPPAADRLCAASTGGCCAGATCRSARRSSSRRRSATVTSTAAAGRT